MELKQLKTQRSFLIIVPLLVVAILLINACSTPISVTPRVINWYYDVILPEGWEGKYLSDNESLIPSIYADKTDNNGASFNVANYKAQGVPLETMMRATIGEINLPYFQGMTVHNTNFQGYPALMVRGILQGNHVTIIGFFGPTGLYSYIWAKNLTDEELDELLEGVELVKTIKPEYVDFDVVWKAYTGTNQNQIVSWQQISPGVQLQGWNYNRREDTLTMTVIFEGNSMAVRAYLTSGFEASFLQELKNKNMIIQIANNYGIKVIINVLDQGGNPVTQMVVK